MELAKGQLVIIYEDLKGKEDGDIVSWQWGVIQDLSLDGMCVIAKEYGGLFLLNLPCDKKEVRFPTKNGEPVIAKKNIFGKYKFPKGRV
jgi:hypothetical protein